MTELGPPGLLEQVRTTTDGLQRPLEAGAFVTKIARHAAQRASHASVQQAKIQNLLMHAIHRPSDCTGSAGTAAMVQELCPKLTI